MSTYWGYRCNDCDEEGERQINHDNGTLANYTRAYALLVQHDCFDGWLELTCDIMISWGAAQEFLADHAGHHLQICSEYGERKEISSYYAD